MSMVSVLMWNPSVHYKIYPKREERVTVHSMTSNTLRDAHKMLFHNILALQPSGFPQKHAETPRGTVACEQ